MFWMGNVWRQHRVRITLVRTERDSVCAAYFASYKLACFFRTFHLNLLYSNKWLNSTEISIVERIDKKMDDEVL